MNLNALQRFLNSHFSYSVSKYNHKKYWKLRDFVVKPLEGGKFRQTIGILLKIFALYRIKKTDGYNNASLGTSLDKSAHFASPPPIFRMV